MARIHYCPVCLTTFEAPPDTCPNLGCRTRRPKTGWGQLLTTGDVLDRHYLVDKLLALGGGGATYLARELDTQGEDFGPQLAIKVLYAQRDSGNFLRRLATEAQIIQELHHEHIVECRGFVTRAGISPYLVTRFESGESLEEHIERVGPLSPLVAGGILRQIAEALRVAHKRKVIHRDLKPANVLLHRRCGRTAIPHVRVADFGIARVSGGFADGMTRQGAFVGTPQYAAPEQFRYEDTTAAIDIFALGGILVYLLTGEPPVQLPARAQLSTCLEQLLDQLPPVLDGEIRRSERGRILQYIVDGTMTEYADNRWELASIIEHLDYVLGLSAQRPAPPARLGDGEDVEDPPSVGEPLPTDEARPAPPRQRAAPASRTPVSARTRVPGMPVTPSGGTPPVDRPAGVPAVGADLGTTAAGGPPKRRWRRAERHVPQRAAPAARVRSAPSQRPAQGAPASAAPMGLEDLFGAAPSAPLDLDALVAGDVDVLPQGDATWTPVDPAAVPGTLPDDAADLLRLLGAVAWHDRARLLDAVVKVPPRSLLEAVRSHKTGDDALLGRGIALVAEMLQRKDLQPHVRSLLADPDDGVRAAAVVGLGAVAAPSDFRTLVRMLAKGPVPLRIAAVHGVVGAAGQLNRADDAVSMLRRLATDGAPGLDVAVEQALLALGR